MTARSALTDDHARRLVEATAWRVRLTEEEVESCAAFEEWLEDPANAAAWAQVDGPWQRVGEEATSPEFMAARTAALQSARRHASKRWRVTSFVTKFAAVLGLLAVLGLAGHSMVRLLDAPTVYRTANDERRVVALADGSEVSLDSATELRVRYTNDERRLDLIAGQARFHVARDTTRPFRVHARDQTVVATGTVFNIDLLGPRVLVTLIEGRVTVLNVPASATDARAEDGSMALAPGEQLQVALAGPSAVSPVSVTRATAWETGQLIFENEPLATAVERVSRYSRRAVRVDGEAGALRVSGVFRTGDAATFIDAVSGYLPVEANADADGGVTLRSIR